MPGSGSGRALVVVGLVVSAVCVVARDAFSHPLHSTLTEVTITGDGRVQLVLRAFVDDFAAAVARRPAAAPGTTQTPADTAVARYLETSLLVADASGRRLQLRVTGIRRANELIWVTLHAPAGRTDRGVSLTNGVLFERFDDQVNIVQATIAGRHRTLLFTRREGAVLKSLAP